MRWNPFRRSPDHAGGVSLQERAAAAETATAAGRYELARAELLTVIEECRRRLADHPDDVEATDLLAAALAGLVPSLEKLRHFDELAEVLDEGMTTSRHAVELHGRTSGANDPARAGSLRTFGLVRAQAGAELDEAEAALSDALAVHMAVLAADPSQEHLAQTYATELAQARLLAQQGRHVEAARVADLARSGHLDGLLDMLRAQRGP